MCGPVAPGGSAVSFLFTVCVQCSCSSDLGSSSLGNVWKTRGPSTEGPSDPDCPHHPVYSPHSAFTPSMLAQGASCPHGTFGKVSDVPGCQQLGMEALLLASRGQSQGGCKTSTCTGQASTGLSSPKGPQGGSRETRLHTDGLLLLGPAEVGTTISIPRRREAWR